MRDPTYLEALEFIELDQTDKNQYKVEKYTCADFAIDFKTNAFRTGYRCGYVLVLFANCSHALNCFNTPDYGLIFIEPQEDDIITLTVGQPYWDRTRYAPMNYDDTIVGYLIIWEIEEAQKFKHRPYIET